MRQLLDPKLDYIFKNIFGVEKNKRLLISLLNAILDNNPKINEVVLENTEITKILEKDKASRLDIKATSDNNTKINIEIQCRNTGDIPHRAIHYMSNLIPRTLERKESYDKIKVISIWILGENVTDRNRPISEAYMTFQESDNDPYQIMSDCARIIFIELKKFNPQTSGLRELLNAWLSFLKDPIYMDEEYLGIKEVHEAMETLKYISLDDDTREIADLRRQTLNDMISETTLAREEGILEGRITGKVEGRIEGIEEGLKKGKEEGLKEGANNKTLEIARNMKSKGFDNETIATCLNLDIKDIEHMLKD